METQWLLHHPQLHIIQITAMVHPTHLTHRLTMIKEYIPPHTLSPHIPLATKRCQILTSSRKLTSAKPVPRVIIGALRSRLFDRVRLIPLQISLLSMIAFRLTLFILVWAVPPRLQEGLIRMLSSDLHCYYCYLYIYFVVTTFDGFFPQPCIKNIPLLLHFFFVD